MPRKLWVDRRRTGQPQLFGSCEGLSGLAGGTRAAEFHLYEHQRVAIDCGEVDLAFAPMDIGCNRLVTVGGEISGGTPLAGLAKTLTWWGRSRGQRAGASSLEDWRPRQPM